MEVFFERGLENLKTLKGNKEEILPSVKDGFKFIELYSRESDSSLREEILTAYGLICTCLYFKIGLNKPAIHNIFDSIGQKEIGIDEKIELFFDRLKEEGVVLL